MEALSATELSAPAPHHETQLEQYARTARNGGIVLGLLVAGGNAIEAGVSALNSNPSSEQLGVATREGAAITAAVLILEGIRRFARRGL
jgi:hypothetical protein